jgi:8-amino-7-oxononanoate synthase
LGMTGDSPIIPIILQSETATLAAASAMRAEGMLVAAVRPPTVPRGSSRLRITLCCEHTDLEVNELIAAVKQLIC